MRYLYLLIAIMATVGMYAQDGRDTIVLVNDSILLEEVIVKADKKLVTLKADRYVVDARQLRIGKNSLHDLLRDVPGVIQDRNSVSILGKGQVKVMINGRLKQIPSEQLVNFLKSYRASEVEQVEVIYQSGAEYDASGDFGILNFVIKPKENFVGGDVSNSLTVSDYVSNETGANLRYNRKRFTSYLSIGYNNAKEYGWNENRYFYTGQTRGSQSENWNWTDEWRTRFGMDYQLDKKSVVSVEGSFSDNQASQQEKDEIRSDNGNPTENTVQQSRARHHLPQRYWDLSFYADRKWTNGLKTQLALDYYNRKQNQDYAFTSDLYDSELNLIQADNARFLNKTQRHLKGFSYTLDLSWKIQDGFELKTGTKGSFSEVDNSSEYDYSNMDTQNNQFDYHENCQAAYLVLTKRLFGCLDTRLGGRYEHTFTKGISDRTYTDKKDYGRLFPDIRIGYRFGAGNQLNISFSGSIVRPWMSRLNPFRLYNSPYEAREGTPDLKPSYFNKVELQYLKSFGWGMFSLTGAYASSKDQMAEILYMTAEGTALYKWANAYEQQDWRLYYMLNYGHWKWVKINLMGSFNRENPKPIDGYERYNCKNTRYSQSIQLTFLFDKDQHFTGSLYGSIMTPRKTPYETYDTYGFLRGGLDYVCCKDKLNIGVYVYNLVPIAPSGTYYANDGMTSRYTDHTFRTSVCFSISYTFGKDIREQIKISGSSDIKGRF